MVESLLQGLITLLNPEGSSVGKEKNSNENRDKAKIGNARDIDTEKLAQNGPSTT